MQTMKDDIDDSYVSIIDGINYSTQLNHSQMGSPKMNSYWDPNKLIPVQVVQRISNKAHTVCIKIKRCFCDFWNIDSENKVTIYNEDFQSQMSSVYIGSFR